MIEIERMCMHLPSGFEHRAMSITRLVGKGLAARHMPEEISLDDLTLPRVKIRLHSSDSEVADLIVREIVKAVEGWGAEV